MEKKPQNQPEEGASGTRKAASTASSGVTEEKQEKTVQGQANRPRRRRPAASRTKKEPQQKGKEEKDEAAAPAEEALSAEPSIQPEPRRSRTSGNRRRSTAKTKKETADSSEEESSEERVTPKKASRPGGKARGQGDPASEKKDPLPDEAEAPSGVPQKTEPAQQGSKASTPRKRRGKTEEPEKPSSRRVQGGRGQKAPRSEEDAVRSVDGKAKSTNRPEADVSVHGDLEIPMPAAELEAEAPFVDSEKTPESSLAAPGASERAQIDIQNDTGTTLSDKDDNIGTTPYQESEVSPEALDSDNDTDITLGTILPDLFEDFSSQSINENITDIKKDTDILPLGTPEALISDSEKKTEIEKDTEIYLADLKEQLFTDNETEADNDITTRSESPKTYNTDTQKDTDIKNNIKTSYEDEGEKDTGISKETIKTSRDDSDNDAGVDNKPYIRRGSSHGKDTSSKNESKSTLKGGILNDTSSRNAAKSARKISRENISGIELVAEEPPVPVSFKESPTSLEVKDGNSSAPAPSSPTAKGARKKDLYDPLECGSIQFMGSLKGFAPLGMLFVLMDILKGAEEGIIRVNQLARALAISKPSMLAQLDNLEAAGLIRTISSSHLGRHVELLCQNLVRRSGEKGHGPFFPTILSQTFADTTGSSKEKGGEFSNKQLADLSVYLLERGVEVVSVPDESDLDPRHSQLAAFIGKYLAYIQPFYARLKATLNQGEEFTYSLAGLQSRDITHTLNFCKMLKDVEFLRQFVYRRAPHRKIVAQVNRIPTAINFLSGGWLEHYIRDKIVSILTTHPATIDLPHAFMKNPQILMPGEEDFELDFLLNVGGQIFWIEAKTGEYLEYLPKYSRVAKILNLNRNTAMLVSVDSLEADDNLTARFDLSCCNIDEFADVFRLNLVRELQKRRG
ncbi:MAG: hypothetical protein GX256_10365 [Fretibacterium sp.]|nr:hypothetical protein [Fretibacterium sp.]